MRTLVMTVTLAVSLMLTGHAAADAQAYVFKGNSDEPVIFFTRIHDRVADVDDHQELSVFADGRVIVHTPVYMKKAGTFEYRLSTKEMQSLVAQLDANGLMSTDWEAARLERDTRAAQRNASTSDRFHVSDLTATHINMNFEQFGKSGSKGKKLSANIVWNDIPVDAERFRNLAAVQQLAKVEKVLLQLTDHSRRNVVRIAGGQ
ncbi:MAG: hypothetical protein AB8G18_02040 [Gammaproteobacteria bacterium]